MVAANLAPFSVAFVDVDDDDYDEMILRAKTVDEVMMEVEDAALIDDDVREDEDVEVDVDDDDDAVMEIVVVERIDYYWIVLVELVIQMETVKVVAEAKMDDLEKNYYP